MLRPYNMATRAKPFEVLQVADIGDVAINTFDLKKTVGIIEKAYDEILGPVLHSADAGRRPHADAAHPARHEEGARAGRA